LAQGVRSSSAPKVPAMQFRLALKNTFLHVEEVETSRERATSDLTDVMLEEGVQRKNTASKSIEDAISRGEVSPKRSLSPNDDGSECSTSPSENTRTSKRSNCSSPLSRSKMAELRTPAGSEQGALDYLDGLMKRDSFDGFGLASTPVASPARAEPQGAASATKDRRRRKNDLYPLDDDVTLMLRNIPNKYTQEQLRQDLEPFRLAIDFLYLPTDFKNNCNLGYAFLNFADGKVAEKFAAQYNGNRLPRFPHSPKVLAVQCARVQGQEANVERFRDSSVMGVRDETMKPMLFNVGEPIPFPAPNGDLPPIGARRKRGPSRFQQNTAKKDSQAP